MYNIGSKRNGYRLYKRNAEKQIASALDYLCFLCEKRFPFEVTSRNELYRKIDEGLEDMRQGRVQPFAETMQEVRQGLEQYGI